MFSHEVMQVIGLSCNTVLASEGSSICRKRLKELKIIVNFEDLQFKKRSKMIKTTLMAF